MTNPKALAAELRRRALEAAKEEREELLFLAAEYDRMEEDAVGVSLPK